MSCEFSKRFRISVKTGTHSLRSEASPVHFHGTLLAVLAGAAMVYVVAHWPALTNPYVINDDVRQQIFWMQQWIDPELFPDDLLCRYARNYVPWGVQAVYYLGSSWFNPVQFTKVVSGLLFIATTGLLFGLGLSFRDQKLAVTVCCVAFFFTAFMRKIAGGISSSFAFPLLLAYLFCLSQGRTRLGGGILLLQSFFNPYIFLLSLVTHGLFLVFCGPASIHRSAKIELASSSSAQGNTPAASPDPGGDKSTHQNPGKLRSLLNHPGLTASGSAPIVAGIGVVLFKHVLLMPEEFGDIVTRAQMTDRPEYTDLGRYPILPIPSLAEEVLRPWQHFFPFEELGPWAGWLSVVVALGVTVFAVTHIMRKEGLKTLALRGVDFSGLRVFPCLLTASVLLYFLASHLLMRLFLPQRYMEYTLNICCWFLTAVPVYRLARAFRPSPRLFPWLVFLFMVLAGLRNYHIGMYDYSHQAPLFRFLATTPKTSLMAGHPDLMDNVVTFARRRALVTYELSHTWYVRYWNGVRERTFDFFRAYYAQNPQDVLDFCQTHGIDYLLVREKDFELERLAQGRVYFAPFDQVIGALTQGRRDFALLNSDLFPPLFQHDGVRVLSCSISSFKRSASLSLPLETP
jgi:hypothetical protein